MKAILMSIKPKWCAFSPKRRLCDNQKKKKKLGTPPDDDICIEGMRKYAEEMEKEE